RPRVRACSCATRRWRCLHRPLHRLSVVRPPRTAASMARVEPTAQVEALARIAGLVHGFGRRAPGPHGETRDETAERVRSGLDGDGGLLLLRQAHGCTVAPSPWNDPPEADAAVAASPGLLLGIQTADCLPVLLVDPVRRTVAAGHARWRRAAPG